MALIFLRTASLFFTAELRQVIRYSRAETAAHIMFPRDSAEPKPVALDDIRALPHFSSLEAYNSPVHKVEVTALEKPGVGRIYAVRRWVLFDEAKMRPMVPPVTDVEQNYVDDATGAMSHLNRLAAETHLMDAHMMGP